jgi:hypothetical protein
VDGSAWTQSLSADELKANPGATSNALVWESTANISTLDKVSLTINNNTYLFSVQRGSALSASAKALEKGILLTMDKRRRVIYIG